MTRARTLFSLLILVVLGLSLGACGKKRPPAVATGGSGARAGRTTPLEPVDSGPDVNPLRDDMASSSDLRGSGPEGSPLDDIHFGFDQAQLTDEARATLQKHAQWIQSRRDVKVSVEGHCDERGTVEYNLALGEQRARATREYLVTLGVPAARLTVVSYGKERPLDPGHGEAAWAKNRRAHFAVSR